MIILIKLTVDINFPIFHVNFLSIILSLKYTQNNGILDCIHVTTCTCFRNIFCHLVKCFDRDTRITNGVVKIFIFLICYGAKVV